MASLFVIRGVDQGTRYELDEPVIGLGRDVANAIQLHDTEISRRHAVIRRENNRYTLSDLGSSNGTYVNGNRVQLHELASGDEVRLGSTALLFTGAVDDSKTDLAARIDIISRQQTDDRSRIVHTLPQDEGSRIFQLAPSGEAAPWLARAMGNLQIMYHTALAVSHTIDIDQLLQRIMQLIFEWVECDRGCVMLLNADTGRLEPRVRRNRRSSQSQERISISQTILDYVIERNEGVLTTDAREDARWDPAASIVQMGIREAICVPMQGRHSMVGVIYIDTTSTPQQLAETQRGSKFSQEHLKLMIAIGHQAALAVEDTRYYSAMVQAERLAAVGQAIASLSHHVKNILQGIRGGSYLIEEGLSRHDENMVRKGWEFVEKNQERISNLVMDMLTFSKEREPEMTAADLNEVLADVVELMQARANERGVTLTYEPAPMMPRLTFDPEGIHRAVLNVVTNAIDACEACARSREDAHEPDADQSDWSGRVDVLAEFDPAESLARVVVKDNGGGIPPDEVEHVFSLFVSNKGHRGTGLGLPVSQKILKEHGGQIRVDSQPGHGCTFVLQWPAIMPDSTRPLDLPSAETAPRSDPETLR